MHPPEKDELEGNPIKPFTDKEVSNYYRDFVFDFNRFTSDDEPEDVEYEFQDHTDRLRAAALEIRKTGNKKEYDEHTDLIHDFFRNPNILQNYFICKNKAFLKLLEIFDYFIFDIFRGNSMRSFHLCEGPGYFVEAVYVSWLRARSLNYREQFWQWGANTLNPYFENKSCFDKLIDDSHIRGHMDHWFFGPSDDGDVEKLTEDYLIKHNLAGTFDLVTADGSTNTQGQEGQIETIVNKLIRAEVKAALKLLRTRGRLILKTYRFCLKETRDVIYLLADNFSSIQAIKPMASRPGSSERYLVCDGFGGKMHIDACTLLACDEFFIDKQTERMEMHVNTFAEKEQAYTWDDRRKFMEVMKKRHFTAQNAAYRKELTKLFPIGFTKEPSPWMKLYGHNLIRRYNPADLPNSIERYISSANVMDPDSNPLDVEQIVEMIMEQEELCITSNVILQTQDSLFIDPIAFQAIKCHEPKVYYDLFENISTINDPFCHGLKSPVQNENRHFTYKMSSGVSIGDFLEALAEGFDSNMESFTLTELPEATPPLWLSRISASLFVLFYTIFEECETMPRMIRWSGLKGHESVRGLIARLRREISAYPPATSIRCFVPLHLLDAFHSRICYQNVLHLTATYRSLNP